MRKTYVCVDGPMKGKSIAVPDHTEYHSVGGELPHSIARAGDSGELAGFGFTAVTYERKTIQKTTTLTNRIFERAVAEVLTCGEATPQECWDSVKPKMHLMAGECPDILEDFEGWWGWQCFWRKVEQDRTAREEWRVAKKAMQSGFTYDKRYDRARDATIVDGRTIVFPDERDSLGIKFNMRFDAGPIISDRRALFGNITA